MRCVRVMPVIGMIALVVAGCQNRDAIVVGKWRNPMGTVYSFYDDKTFTRNSKTGTASGTWSLSGNKLTTVVEKVNDQSYSEKTTKAFHDAHRMLPPDYVTLHSRAVFDLGDDGHTMLHKNSTTGKDVPYTKQ